MITKYSVGTRGDFVLSPPFNTMVVNTDNTNNTIVELIVVAVNTIGALNREGFDVYKLIYEPNALSYELYQKDVANGVNILTLYSERDFVNYYIPENYVDGVPDNDYVTYINPMILLNLGPMPSTLNTDALTHGLVEHVTSITGATPENVQIDLVGYDLKERVTLSRHNELETIRKANINKQPTLTLENARLSNEVTELRKEVIELQKILIANNLIDTSE